MNRFHSCRPRLKQRRACHASLPAGFGVLCLGILPVHAAEIAPSAAPKAAPVEPAAPQSPALEDLSLEELMQVQVATVTTASKKSEKSTAAPATVIVITARDIRLRGYATLKDVLRDLPGMETTENYFSESGVTPVLFSLVTL